MKKLLLIVTALLILVFAGNWVYGNVLSRKIEDRLIHFSKQINDRVILQFDNIHVNPLLSKLQFKGLQLTTVDGRELAKGSTVVLDMPYQEAIRLLNGKQVKELKSLKVKIQNLTVFLASQGEQLEVKSLFADFDGNLRKEDLANIQVKLPELKQRLSISADGVEWEQAHWPDALGFTAMQKKQLAQLNRVKLVCEFKPESKQFELIDLRVNAPLFDSYSNGIVNYSGDGLSAVKLTQSDYDFQIGLKERGMEWGDANSTGKYSIGKLSLKTDARLSYTDSGSVVQSQNIDLDLNDLTVEYAGKRRAQLEAKTALLGLKMDKIVVKKLSLHSGLSADELVIKNSVLQSSILDMSVDAKLELVQSAIKTSQINNATVILSNLAPGIHNGLATLELMTGQKLPRKGEDIVLEMSGSLVRPNIKGIRY